ncbi:hypothetical protein HKX48_002750, partial [Thoreauomyces humboldtii]
MDLHSHLLDTEVVGLLAGVYDETTRECTILTALPAQRKVIADDASITVEASEESLAEAQSVAESLGMQIVGWYHSHPIFATLPSRIDCETQEAHQRAFGTDDLCASASMENDASPVDASSEEDKGKPFLGAICGPYNPKLETQQSDLNWFVVLPDPTGRRGRQVVPRKLNAILQGEDRMGRRGMEEYEVDKM